MKIVIMIFTTSYYLLFPMRNQSPASYVSSGRPSDACFQLQVNRLSNELAMYRQYSEKHKYDMDVDNGPATAFHKRFPCVNQLHWTPSEPGIELHVSFMLPICLTPSTTCIGVLEFTADANYGYSVLAVIDHLKQAGLHIPGVQELIPYKTIYGLQLAKDKIDVALRVVCGSHNLALAQVWIAYEDKNHVSVEQETQKKRLLALKLAGRAFSVTQYGYTLLHRFCSEIPLAEEGLALRALQDYESRYVPKLHSDMLIGWNSTFFNKNSALTICLRSNDTLDLDYAFEFVWANDSNSVISLEAVLLTLRKCLPRFKFASGAELGDELDVIVVNTPTSGEVAETQKLKIFQGKRSSTVREAGKPLEVTSPNVLSQEIRQFGKQAAENLHGSESTMKRKLRDLMPPGTLKKRKANDLFIIQVNANGNESTQDSSIDNIQRTLTVKAGYGDDVI